MGLYLRAHNDFTVEVNGKQSVFLQDERFYRAAAVAALPGYPSWLAAAVRDRRERGDPARFSYARGMETRLARALRARDFFDVRIRAPRPDDTWSEALFFFDAALLNMSGALDAAARFCHLTYELTGKPSRAGFARHTWRRQLTAKAPSLGWLLGEDGALPACAGAVGVLRNYVHGEDLSQELHEGEGKRVHTIDYGPGALALNAGDAERLLAVATVLGAPEQLGLEQAHGEALLVLPAGFLARIVPVMLRALGELIVSVETAAELMPGVEQAVWLPDVGHDEELLLLTGLSGTGARAS